MKKQISKILLILLTSIFITGCSLDLNSDKPIENGIIQDNVQLTDIPEFNDEPYIVLNENVPMFTEEETASTEIFEDYSDLDRFGRCGIAYANLHQSIMPTEDRESIGMIKPSGWKTAKYDFVDGKYLYNRCHLIGFQLAGENANEKNLITGTRFLNVEGMLPFENMVADYLKETNNHVLYRVTPVFKDNELVARGVTIEGYSVEDHGEGIQFYVYCYNNQPKIEINYQTGDSKEIASSSENEPNDSEKRTFIVNKNSKKFHEEDCENANKISSKNREVVESDVNALIEEGYEPAQCCVDN